MDPEIEKRFDNVDKSKTFKNIVRSFDLDKKSVLDIGCSNGEFLIKFGPESTGVTIIQSEVDYGKTKSLDIRYGNIESDDFTLDKKYDVIFANNIFEHLYSPHAFLSKIKEYLNPDGILILGVPCVPGIIPLTKFKKFRGSLALAHINFFTKYTLSKTTEAGGWKVSDTRGFRFFNKFIDHLLDPIYPHFYVISTPDPDFKYTKKRMRELIGYKNI